MEEELIDKKDIKKKKNILTLSILSTIIILLGSAYAFFTYFKSAEAFTLTSNSITASFTEGTNQISFTNAYPISDEFALQNLSKLDYIDFTVSGNAINSKEAITYEIFLTEANGNTLSNNFVKLYLTDGNNNEVVSPNIYGNLGTTTYTSEPTGKVILTKTLSGKFSKSYRLYCWLDSTFEDNTISRTFSFYVNLYAYNNTSNNADSEITINNIEDLVNLSNAVNSGTTYSGVYVNLNRSLDFEDTNSYEDSTRTDYGDINGNGTVETLINELTNTCNTCGGFIPIGKDETNSFQGTFNGNNYRIDNIYENNVNNNSNLGLFRYVKNATINNLTIGGSIVGVTNHNLGGFVAVAYGKNKLDNCHNEINITSNFGNYSVAGIVASNGSNAELDINNCSNSGNMSNSYNPAGLVGLNDGTLIIKDSNNSGNITDSKGACVGGLVGRDNGSSNITTITNSYNTGTITSDFETVSNSKSVGGLVGNIKGTINIKDSNNQGVVVNTTQTSEYGIHIAGIVGTVNRTTNIENTYNTGNITGGNHVGGIIGISSNNSNVIINKVYNTGTIYSIATSNGDYDANVGGLVGQSWHSNLKILNSYNYGNVTGLTNTGGLIGGVGYDTIKIINGYNIGNVESTTGRASGIARTISTTTLTSFNNVYNLGSVVGSNSSSGVSHVDVDIDVSKSSITNAYYINTIVNGVSGKTALNSYTTPMSLNDMKSQTFVNTLNNNVNNINLSSIDSSLANYSLSKWKLGTDGYPVFEWQN